jgi:hypothetical protein
MGRIILEKQCIGLRISQIVDRDQIQIMIITLENSARDKAANPPKSVDCNFGSH